MVHDSNLNIVLYQPDIALNLGAAMRLAACFNVTLHIIEPCGFPFDLKKIKRSAMDYIDKVDLYRHASWKEFIEFKGNQKLYLLSTKATSYYYEAEFNNGDYLIFGSESSGAGEEVWNSIDKSLKIPLKTDCRSLNLSSSIAITLSEALRQNKFTGLE